MRALPFIIALLALAPAAAAQSQTVSLQMTDDASGHYFLLPATGARNPVIGVAAGTTVIFNVENTGTVQHNLRFGAPLETGTPCCQDPGQTARVEVTIPADATGDIPYWDVLHRDLGMEGVLRVTRAPNVPQIKIIDPVEDATVPHAFTVRVEVNGFTLEAPGGNDTPGRGHLHYVLDGAPNADTVAKTLAVDLETTGYHVVRVELVTATHAPLDPPIFAERIVFVSDKAPPESGTPTPTTVTPPPADETPAPGVLAVALVAVGVALLARRRA